MTIFFFILNTFVLFILSKLKNNLLLLSFISFFFLTDAKSQLSSFPIITSKDTVFIGYIEGKYFLSHVIKKEDNLNSIASYYGTSLTAIREINGMTDSQLKTNKTIKIPIPYNRIKSPVLRSSSEKYSFIPVFYKVKKGDTLYKLFRIYFPRDSKEIKNINSIKTNIIKIDSKLLIGYYPVQHIEKPSTNIVLQTNRNKDTLSLTSDKSKNVLVTVSGAAKTFDSPFEKTEYAYVLSNKIPEHSVVELTNPMSNKKLTGKVIGKIPPGKYPLDILLLLAKNDALDLGFLDLKFFVSVKYYK
jgi:LysM repeat protein